MKIKHVIVAPNTTGVDYFIGDIHGEHDVLMQQLDSVGFSRNSDRLFSVGDIIDRGPNSLECLKLATEPWFYAVRGNHEDMSIDALEWTGDAGRYARALSYRNGGAWLDSIDEVEREQALATLLSLPGALTIESNSGNKPIGVIHAGWRGYWADIINGEDISNSEAEFALWARKDRLGATRDNLLSFLVCGHQNIESPTVYGSHVCIDTLMRSGRLSVRSEGELRAIFAAQPGLPSREKY
ncbi:metallophosphoesterase [Parahaliea aestuarii]|uniref:Metallophosphoesterase n=1 Tax=Parahaliea aestuarii TaxID=1852021 RepID=A0A5C8ZKD4_9GAMM|nr:metallophosphoesterase [Parahaliea aestuarii]TXS88943.1 metallophosphoesterase [Parahaliea aestuarii]